MRSIRVGRGSKDLLNLSGNKKYSIQATVRTISVIFVGRDKQLVDRDLRTLHHDFSSSKTPKDAALEYVLAFLRGFEIAGVKVDARDRIIKDIKILTINRVESVDLFVHSTKGFFVGQLEIKYQSMFHHFCALAQGTPNLLTSWGNPE